MYEIRGTDHTHHTSSPVCRVVCEQVVCKEVVCEEVVCEEVVCEEVGVEVGTRRKGCGMCEEVVWVGLSKNTEEKEG